MALFIFGSINCFAQSKSETENWIISVVEDPEYRFNIYHVYSVSFSNGYMIIRSPSLQGNLTEEIIQLKSLGKIKIQKLDNGFRLTINCSLGNCIKNGEYSDNNLGNYKYISNSKQSIIMFGPSLQYDNLVIRLKKALVYLVEMYGGKLVDEPF